MQKLLIADDEKIERMVLYRTLKKKLGIECDIYEAENGRKAVEIAQREDISIAILDIEMPGMNGIEAAEKMKERNPECMIIFLTAYDDFCYTKKAITIRAMDYLLKPFDEIELLTVVETALRKSAQLQEREEKREREQEIKQEITPMEGEELQGHPQVRLAVVAKEMETYIQKNYHSDLSMQDVAEAMDYSDAYFCKLFKQCFHMNFTTYITQVRIAEAKRLLAIPSNQIKSVGEMVGYSDSNYFAKVFKRCEGITPTEFRMQIFATIQ